MAMPVVSIRYENPRAYIYSPFSGLPAVSEKDYDGGNKDNPTPYFSPGLEMLASMAILARVFKICWVRMWKI